MIKVLINCIKYIVSSFDNFTKGASGRKLTAFWIVVFIITPANYYYIFVNKLKPDFITWLLINFLVVLLLLGLITFEQILKFKNINNIKIKNNNE